MGSRRCHYEGAIGPGRTPGGLVWRWTIVRFGTRFLKESDSFMLVTVEGSKRMPGEQFAPGEAQYRQLFGTTSSGLTDLLGKTHDCVIARNKEGRITLWNRA